MLLASVAGLAAVAGGSIYRRWRIAAPAAAASLVLILLLAPTNPQQGDLALQLGSREPQVLAEAHKCLANVEVADARVRKPENEPPGTLASAPRYVGTGVDRALDHVNKAIALSPNDLSIHIGRITLLVRSSRFDQIPAAMEESLGLYHGPEALDHWLEACGRIYESALYDNSFVEKALQR